MPVENNQLSSKKKRFAKKAIANQHEKLFKFTEDENRDRGNWSGKMDFLLSCLGYAVGLGNVWRFPYICYKNGGGAFLIPYLIMALFVGQPLLFLQLSLGQFTSNGPLTCWDFAPLFRGIGRAFWIAQIFIVVYYSLIISWSVYYLCASFSIVLPWQTCDGWWNSKWCYSLLMNSVNCTKNDEEGFENSNCFNRSDMSERFNDTVYENVTGNSRISSSEEYFNNRVLRISGGIDDQWNGPYWDLSMCLLAVWVLVFLCLIKGVKSSGKVVYFTATFPYVVLIILFIKGLTLPGSSNGIYFYTVPTFDRLLDSRVWVDAAAQVFFGLGLGCGGMITLGSYNRFHHNNLRDSIIVAMGNCLTSVLAGFVIFPFLGYMAHVQNTTIDEAASSGPGLAFIVYPTAVSLMPMSTLWSVLFFTMLLTLGLDTLFVGVESIITAVTDLKPNVFRSRKLLITFFTTLFGCLLALPLCTNAGPYVIRLVDNYIPITVVFMGILETFSISVIYGSRRFLTDIEVMIGHRPSCWWQICWTLMTPGLVGGIFVFSWIDYSPTRYGNNYFYPQWADAIGWCCFTLIISCVPVYGLYYALAQKGSFIENFRKSMKPTIFWGPALVRYRKLISPHVVNYFEDPWNGKLTASEEENCVNVKDGAAVELRLY